MATKRGAETTAKAVPSKKAKATEPSKGDDGWTSHPPSLIYKAQDTAGSEKVAAFDFDGTIVVTKSGLEFPKDADDWTLFNPKVPEIIQGIHKDGYKIIIFTNQGMIKSALGGAGATKVKTRLDAVIKILGVPVDTYIATQKDTYRKPETGMWEFMCSQITDGVQPDKKCSYYVGDAAGRPGDFAASDKEFAQAIGIEFKTPEQFFGEREAAPAEGENGALCTCFDQLSQQWRTKGDNFKANAFKKVSAALAAHPTKIKSGKEASALKGVGKASSALIDEFLSTGKMQVLLDMQAGGADGAEAAADSQKVDAKTKNPGLAFL